MNQTVDAIKRSRVDVWRIEGTERSSGEAMTAFVAGEIATKSYLANVLFRDIATETHRRMWLWSAFRIAADCGRGHTVAFVETDFAFYRRLYRRRAYWLPTWVQTELDADRLRELARRSGNIEKDVRRIQRSGFRPVISSNPRDLEDFFQEMYLPYARERFGAHLVCATLGEVQQAFG